MNTFKILIVGPVFIILLVIIYQTLKQSQIFDTTKSAILSICVSVLAIIGLNSHFKDSIRVLLIPYAAMAIAVLAVLLVAFIGKATMRTRRMLPKRCKKKKFSNTDKKRRA